MDRKFTIFEEIIGQYRRLNTVGSELMVRLLPPLQEDEREPISYFMDRLIDMCEYALRNCNDWDMVGISIRDEVNMNTERRPLDTLAHLKKAL